MANIHETSEKEELPIAAKYRWPGFADYREEPTTWAYKDQAYQNLLNNLYDQTEAPGYV